MTCIHVWQYICIYIAKHDPPTKSPLEVSCSGPKFRPGYFSGVVPHGVSCDSGQEVLQKLPMRGGSSLLVLFGAYGAWLYLRYFQSYLNTAESSGMGVS